jgi:hypothetical protein
VFRVKSGSRPRGRRAVAPPNPTSPKIKKKTHFVDTISKVLRDLTFSRNQSLKSADDYYIIILKNKLMKLKKKQGG